MSPRLAAAFIAGAKWMRRNSDVINDDGVCDVLEPVEEEITAAARTYAVKYNNRNAKVHA